MSLSDLTAVFALVISLASAIIAVLSYLQNGARAQLKNRQIECMRAVATRAAILWDQLQTILSAKKYGFLVDPYLFPSIQTNARRLEQALDSAISVGLIEEIISTRPNAFPLYTAFLQSLYYVTTLSSTEEITAALVDDHFTLGMVRLRGQCLDFGRRMLPEGLSGTVTISENKELAWGYLDKKWSNEK